MQVGISLLAHTLPASRAMPKDHGQRLNPKFVEYCRAVKNLVNPQPLTQATTLLYVGSGADISTALLVSDADRLIMVDPNPFGAVAGPYSQHERRYLEEKLNSPFALVDSFNKAGTIGKSMLADLHLIGVDQPAVLRSGNVTRLSFTWGAVASEVRPRQVWHIAGRLPHAQKFPVETWQAGLDFLMVKACGNFRARSGDRYDRYGLDLGESVRARFRPNARLISDLPVADGALIGVELKFWEQETRTLNDLAASLNIQYGYGGEGDRGAHLYSIDV